MAGAVAAQQLLEVTLTGLTDADARRPSHLPGWTVGHVLTHIARNADSHLRALLGAREGVVIDRYPGGEAQRDAEIDEGAPRPAAELVADVEATAASLAESWHALPAPAWAAVGSCVGQPEPLETLPFKRWREVEVHHADLGLAFGIDDWSDGFVGRELRTATMAWRARMPMGQTDLPAAALALPPKRRAAWLLGRIDVPGLPEPGAFT
jgi:maleylpyruvate isomerase